MPKVIPEIQAGSGTTDVNGDASVTFPSPYASTPKVFLQGVDAGAKGIVLDVVSKTTTGFAVKARKVTGLPTGSALQGMHYYTASAVTGIPTATGSGGVDHTHGYSGTTGTPSATATPVDNVYYGTSYAWSSASTYTLYAATTSGGSPTSPFAALPTTVTRIDAVTSLSVDRVTVASGTHTHGYSGTTGGASAYSHTHSIGAASTGTFVTSLTILPEDWLTVIVGDAPVLAVDFDWLSILA